MKRCYAVKIKGSAPFSMIIMDMDEEPEQICRCIWGDRLEWVK